MMETQDVQAPTEIEAVANPIDANTESATAAEAQGDEGQAKEERVFSQAEVDALIQKRLAKESRRAERRMAEELARYQQQAKPEPTREDFATDDEHQRAAIEHAIAKKAEEIAEKRLTERQMQAKQAEAEAGFWEKADEVAERYPDFDAVVRDPSLPLNGPILEFVMDSDVGPELAYHLGKHKSEAIRLSQMSPVKAVLRLVEIQNEIKAKPKARISNAPQPMQPIGNRGKAISSALPSDSDDMETWAAKERKRIASLR